jgi:hypothetical protein
MEKLRIWEMEVSVIIQIKMSESQAYIVKSDNSPKEALKKWTT